MKKYILSSTLFILIFTLSFASACSCAVNPDNLSVNGELSNSDAVFTGMVFNIKKTGGYFTHSYNVAKLNLIESFKGTSNKKIAITTPKYSASCGFNFVENKTYLVYANEKDNKLQVSICSKTKTLNSTEKDEIKILRNLSHNTTYISGNLSKTNKSIFENIINWFYELFN